MREVDDLVLNVQKHTLHQHGFGKRLNQFHTLLMLHVSVFGLPRFLGPVFNSDPSADRPGIEVALNMWTNGTCLGFTSSNVNQDVAHIKFVAKERLKSDSSMFIKFIYGFFSACATDWAGPKRTPPYATTIDANLCLRQVIERAEFTFWYFEYFR